MSDTERPMLTFSEAAHAASVDRRTIRRWKDGGKLPNAVMVEGVWRVPVEDLLAAGAQLHAPTPPDEPDPTPPPDELERLRAEVAEYRRRAEVAEAVAEERGAALDDARLALRALTAGEEARRDRFTWQPDDVTVTPPPEKPKRWWRR